MRGTTYTASTERAHDLRVCNNPNILEDVNFIMEHLNDPNFNLEPRFESDLSSISRVVSRESIDLEDDLPYPEVQTAVSTVDDPLIPVNTFRMWFLGILFVLLTSGFNQVFLMRYPSIFITGIVVQLVCLPFGRGITAILPTKRFNTFGYIWSLNPGPFSIKEHVCITVMSNVIGSGAYSTHVVLTQHFYGQTTPMGFQLLLALGSQTLGFCLGGLIRQFVVWPSSMIWPGALVNSMLFNTLHRDYGKHDKGHMTRKRFFFITVAASFIWYWVPSYLFTALRIFNWVCWIAPKNIVINVLFGLNTGLGMSALTFDWGMIALLGSPLAIPWWSQMNTAVAFLLIFWLIAPVLYFTNVWNSAYFPISGRISFDNTGSPYNAQHIITNGVFDPVKYAAYSPVFLPVNLALTYGAAFAAFPALFMHIFLWFRKDIIRRFRNTLKDEYDVHSRLMKFYPEVPMWWYGIVGIISFAFFCIAIRIIPTQFPVWASVIGILLASALAIPLSILQAITNQYVTLQVIHELIGGYLLPGQPIANTIFKTITSTTCAQAIIFAGDLKLGHYMKIPPRMMFTIQVIATIVGSIWVTFIQEWMLSNIEDICTPRQPQGFICPGSTTFSTASVIWGAVGPRRLFNPGSPYSALLWFFPIGLLAPIPFYLLALRFPLGIWRYINVPAFFSTLLFLPQSSGINYISWVLCGFIFNYAIRRSRFRWWIRYNYILAASLEAGTAISMIAIFFTLMLPKMGGVEFNWWGNTVWKNTADYNGTPLKPLPESGFIGPAKWS